MTIWQKAAWVIAICLALYVSVASLLGDTAQLPLPPWQGESKKPNIVFIMSDDQDMHMDSLSYMPLLKKHIIDEGTFYRRHYCTVALCCPSRASLLTGRAAHNTNVTDINPPYGRSLLTPYLSIYPIPTSADGSVGGYPKFISQGFNSAYLPIFLQSAGYATYYVGKLLNAQTITNYDSPHAAGWDGSDFLLDPYTYRYLNATFQRNHEEPVSYEGQYSTGVLAEKAYDFLDDAVKGGKPFFLGIAPTAPHSDVNIKENLIDGNFSEHSVVQSPPIPAERHKHLFEDVVVPRTPHFNPNDASGVSWISTLPKQNSTNVEFNDDFYRNRLRALQAVDEMIDGVMTRLQAHGILEETYIFYTTDNGYHIGQHRLQPGKQCAFEEDINIPMAIRGPGIAKGMVTDVVTSHTDLAPTFLSLAGGKLRDDFDGVAMPLFATDDDDRTAYADHEDELTDKKRRHKVTETKKKEQRQEHVNVESWGIIMSEGRYGSHLYLNHTYKALRIIGEEYNLLYTVWCSGEHELYDVNQDPWQMENLYGRNQSRAMEFGETRGREVSGIGREAEGGTFEREGGKVGKVGKKTTLKHLIPRLDALLMVLKTCEGRQCTHPWEYLHPKGDVLDLHDALHRTYDEFYEEQMQRVEYGKCEKGYILESEGTLWDGKGKMAYGMSEEMAYW